jgi:hypothetical protein
MTTFPYTLRKMFVYFLNLSRRAVPEKSDYHVFFALHDTQGAITILYIVVLLLLLFFVSPPARSCSYIIHHWDHWQVYRYRYRSLRNLY